MELLLQCNALDFTWNWWKWILIVFLFSQTNFIFFTRIPILCSFFLQLQKLLSYLHFCDSSLNKNCKTYLGPMLPPAVNFTNWFAKRHKHKLKPKLPFCITKNSAGSLLPILSYNFCTECHFWHIFAKCCCHLKHQQLSAQNILSFGAKKVGGYPHWQYHSKLGCVCDCQSLLPLSKICRQGMKLYLQWSTGAKLGWASGLPSN
jgi:hypothetical protein